MHSLKTVHLRPRLSAEQIGVMEENGSWRRTENDTVGVEGGKV